jgi:hypothetical protein
MWLQLIQRSEPKAGRYSRALHLHLLLVIVIILCVHHLRLDYVVYHHIYQAAMPILAISVQCASQMQ